MTTLNQERQKSNKKRTITILVIGIVIILLVYFIYKHTNRNNLPSTTKVKVGTIEEEVYISGKVKARKSVDLSFRSNGQVKNILVQEGERVRKGQILATLDNKDLWAKLKQAQADQEAAEAQLQKLKKGARPEEINIKKVMLAQTQQKLRDYYQNAWNILNEAYTQSEDAIKIQLKDVFKGSEAAESYQLTFDSCVPQLVLEVDDARLTAEKRLRKWKKSLITLKPSSSPTIIDTAIKEAKGHLVFFQDFINRLNDILLADCSFSNPYLDPYRISANLAKKSIVNAFQDVSTLEQNINNQKLLIQQTQTELNLLLAGATPEEIAIQEAKLKATQAEVSNCWAQIEKSIIRAPFDGIIATKSIKMGDIVQANQPVMTLISDRGLEIESFVSEIDVVKLKKGDKAVVTLDAYGDDIKFPAEIVSIDVGPTIKNGVTTYKTILYFTGKTDLIKPGMSADINVITNKHNNVLIIPAQAIVNKNDTQFVGVITPKGSVRLRPIKTGLRNFLGEVEIVEGLKEGENIITDTKFLNKLLRVSQK